MGEALVTNQLEAVLVSAYFMALLVNVCKNNVLENILDGPFLLIFLVKECPKHNMKICNDKGQCDMSEGTCTCNVGYNGLDCSGKHKK